MRLLVWTIGLLILAVLIRRMLIAAARKGWIYYGNENRPRFSAGNALSMFQPEIEHVIEEEAWGYVSDVDDETGESD